MQSRWILELVRANLPDHTLCLNPLRTAEHAVMLGLPVDRAAERIPPTLGELFEIEDGTLLRMRVGSLDWMASVLAGLDCPSPSTGRPRFAPALAPLPTA